MLNVKCEPYYVCTPAGRAYGTTVTYQLFDGGYASARFPRNVSAKEAVMLIENLRRRAPLR